MWFWYVDELLTGCGMMLWEMLVVKLSLAIMMEVWLRNDGIGIIMIGLIGVMMMDFCDDDWSGRCCLVFETLVILFQSWFLCQKLINGTNQGQVLNGVQLALDVQKRSGNDLLAFWFELLDITK